MNRIKSSLTGVLLVVLGLFLGSVLVRDGVAQAPNPGTEGHLAKWVRLGRNNLGLGNSGITENSDGTLGVPQGIKFADGTVQTTASTSAEGNHHHHLTVVGSPQEQLTIPLPAADKPVRVDIGIPSMQTTCTACENNTTGPILMSGTYYFDSASSQVVFAPLQISSHGSNWCSQGVGVSEVCGVLSYIQGSPVIVVGLYDTRYVASPSVTYNVSMWY